MDRHAFHYFNTTSCAAMIKCFRLQNILLRQFTVDEKFTDFTSISFILFPLHMETFWRRMNTLNITYVIGI